LNINKQLIHQEATGSPHPFALPLVFSTRPMCKSLQSSERNFLSSPATSANLRDGRAGQTLCGRHSQGLKYRATIMFSNRAEVPGTWAILFPTI